MQPNSFTGAGAVNSLVGHLDDFGPQNVDAALRLEILTKIRDNAGNHYFRAWLENVAAMDITRDWLKAGLTAKNDNLLVETIMPLLHIVDRLPMTVDALKASKLGKIVVKLVKEPPAPGEHIQPSFIFIRRMHKMMNYVHSALHACIFIVLLLGNEYTYLTTTASSGCSCQGHGGQFRTQMAPVSGDCDQTNRKQ